MVQAEQAALEGQAASELQALTLGDVTSASVVMVAMAAKVAMAAMAATASPVKRRPYASPPELSSLPASRTSTSLLSPSSPWPTSPAPAPL